MQIQGLHGAESGSVILTHTSADNGHKCAQVDSPSGLTFPQEFQASRRISSSLVDLARPLLFNVSYGKSFFQIHIFIYDFAAETLRPPQERAVVATLRPLEKCEECRRLVAAWASLLQKACRRQHATG